jgi:hypothetical protein
MKTQGMDGGPKFQRTQGAKQIKQDLTGIMFELGWTAGWFLKSAGAL